MRPRSLRITNRIGIYGALTGVSLFVATVITVDGALACGGGSSGGDSDGGSSSEGSSGSGQDGRGESGTGDPTAPPAGFVPLLGISGFGDSQTGSGPASNTRDLVDTVSKINPSSANNRQSEMDKKMARAWLVRKRDQGLLAAKQAEADAAYYEKWKKAAEHIKTGAELTNFVLGFFVPAARVAKFAKFEKLGKGMTTGLKGLEAYSKAIHEGRSQKDALKSAAIASSIDAVYGAVASKSMGTVEKSFNKAVARNMMSYSAKAQTSAQIGVRGMLNGGYGAVTGQVANDLNSELDNSYAGGGKP
jgi:hypothetical protein